MNRRERRIYEREERKKVKKIIDWSKVRNHLKFIGLFILFLYLFLTGFSYFVVTDHNNIRKIVSKNVAITEGKVYDTPRKGPDSYEFFIKRKRYEGYFFNSQKRSKGDFACVAYSYKDPNYNLSCNERELETIEKDVIMNNIEGFGYIIIIYIVYIFFIFLFKPKEILRDITSRTK